jgi:hypothetical protein
MVSRAITDILLNFVAAEFYWSDRKFAKQIKQQKNGAVQFHFFKTYLHIDKTFSRR